mgnify:CR=1 FL=1
MSLAVFDFGFTGIHGPLVISPCGNNFQIRSKGFDSQLKTAGDAFQSASSSEPDVRYPYDYRWISPRTFDSGFGADFVSGLSNGYNAAKLVRGSGSTENSPVFSFDESGLLEGGRYIDNTRTRARTRAAMRDTFHQWFGIRIRQNQLTDSPANQVYMPSGNHED